MARTRIGSRFPTRARLGVSAAVAAVLMTAACGGGSQPAKGTADGWASSPVRFVFASAMAPAHIDPALAVDLDSFSATRNLYDPLVWEDSSLKTIPWLATEWSTSGDGLTTTLKLRSGVQFTDGSAFSSADVKLTIERILALKQGPFGLLSAVKGVQAPDPQTVAITTANPDPYLLTHLTRVGIVSSAGVAAHKTGDDPWATKWFDANSDGTGPYTLGSWQKGVQMTLNKNKGWWHGWEPGSVDVAINKFVTETSARVQMVERGTADFTELWPTADALRVGAKKGFKVEKVSTFEIDPMFYLNTKKPPFDNKLVRQAAQLAFDYDAMLSYYKGEATAPTGPIPNDYPGVAQFPPYKRDLEKAKALIQQSGVDLAQHPVRFMLPAGIDSFSVGATIFQQSLQQAGFKVQIQQMPFPQVLAAFSKVETAGESSAIITSPYTADPTVFLGNFYLPGGVYNFSLYDSPQVNQLIATARTSQDEKARTAALQQAQTIVRDDAPAIWAARPKTVVALPEYVTGFTMPLTDYRWSMYFWPLKIKAH